tara:strand:+ start:8447 stop:9949 length:1503 start_codon:yes stop_codon:yes gene_type:complete
MEEPKNILTRFTNGIKVGIDTWRGRKPANISPAITVPPTGGRKSIPSHQNYTTITSSNEGIISPEFIFDIIPAIRKLTMSNPDVSQAFKNLVYLGNTGHRIHFPPDIDPIKANKMRKHLKEASNNWGTGVAGIEGLVSKLFAQIAIGGAISAEMIPSQKLDKLDNVVLVNVETIRWEYKSGRYWPLQKIPDTNVLSKKRFEGKTHVKLNPNTFIYYGMLGDQDIPYGIPPYLPAMNALETQNFMMDNIKFIVEQVGLVGFLQVMVEKPERDVANGESDAKYKSRLEQYLDEAVSRVQNGLRDGVNVGFLDETEFEFHNPAKNASGISEIFKENELQVLSALNMDGALMGRDYTSGFEAVGVIFMKMLSEFVTIQNMIARTLERIYKQELLLAGYRFEDLTVEFKRSTLMDELKMQQGREVLIRNVNSLYNMGQISQDQGAEMLGFNKPDQKEPRVTEDKAKEAEQKEKEKDAEKDRKKDKSRKDGSKDSDSDNKTRKGDR